MNQLPEQRSEQDKESYKGGEHNQEVDYDYDYDSQKNAINQSLGDDTFFNQDQDLLNITNSMFSRNQTNIGSKREDIDTKIAGREMISQRGVNPFLQTSYVND